MFNNNPHQDHQMLPGAILCTHKLNQNKTTAPPLRYLLRNNNQQQQHHNQNHNNRQTPILPRLPTKSIQAPPRPPKLRRMPNHALLHLIQQHNLPIQLLANLHAQLALPANARAELVELVVLVGDDLAVVGVDLLVVEGGVVGGGFGVGVVAVGEEGGAVGVVVVGGVVGEAHGFGRLAWLLLSGGEVGSERGVVGVRYCG